MKKLLWVGDAACPSGFARATHEILERLRREWEVVVLGVNYRGDPHEFPYKIYTALAGGDFLGVGRMNWMCDKEKPDVIVVQNDVWNIPAYAYQLKQVEEHGKIPLVAALAVDGKNCRGVSLKDTALSVFWTKFGLEEARKGGYTGEAEVIPLGVDTEFYTPMDRYEARTRRGLPKSLDEAFIIGSVNRNQPRKRWDLTVKYFAEWILERKIEDAWLLMHTAPTGDTGTDVIGLATYYGIANRIILVEPPVFYGVSEEEMRMTYNCFDLQVTTTQGEGFGLTSFEGMACGVPQIAPDWSALGELLAGAAWLVPCTTTAIGPPYINVIGGVPDQRKFTEGLQRMYADPEARMQNGLAARERALERRFQWEDVGLRWLEAMRRFV